MARKKKEQPLTVGIVQISANKLVSRAANWDAAFETLQGLTYSYDYKIVSLTANPEYLFDLLNQHLDSTAKDILKSFTPELLQKFLKKV